MTESLPLSPRDPDENSNNADNDIDEQIKELKHDFHEVLSDKPDILKYIERLHTIIRRQQKKLNKLYRKLKDHKYGSGHGGLDKETQTDETDISNSVKTGIQVDPDISAPPVKNEASLDSAKEVSADDIVEEIKEAAESAMQQTGFVYEPTSGMYYDYSTGYYYNAELRMYYDGNSGQYLEYDEETKQYKYHVAEGVEVSYENSESSQKKSKKRKEKKQKARYTKKSKFDDAEEGEITESSYSNSNSDSGSDVEELKKPEAVKKKKETEESGVGCEPCIRIMVEDTTVERLKIGSLFVVTCKGGTMGREGDHAVLIPDINVSKHHAKFVFRVNEGKYYIIDLGSRNGTWLDGERLSAALQESEAFEVQHGAVIQVGGTKLLCHVHAGRDTCESCEPGLVQQYSVISREPVLKHPEYKETLQTLKKKFGVDAPQEVYNLPGYEDRAEIRRTTVGSSHHSEKTQAASLSESVPQTNKGFKMLAKMGWSEGQKLGKDNRGLSEPVPIISNEGKSGLGASSMDQPKISGNVKKRQAILKKTQDRYKNIKEARGDEDSE